VVTEDDDDVNDDDDEIRAVFVQCVDFAVCTEQFTMRAAGYVHLILSSQLIPRFVAPESHLGNVTRDARRQTRTTINGV